jgi:hypothetical protein
MNTYLVHSRHVRYIETAIEYLGWEVDQLQKYPSSGAEAHRVMLLKDESIEEIFPRRDILDKFTHWPERAALLRGNRRQRWLKKEGGPSFVA